MINEILSREMCAKCKGCCVFDDSDAWEAPAELLPTLTAGLSVCTHLTKNGCELGLNKPIECAMYPFRVMRMGEVKVIAVSKFCKAVTDLPLTKLLQFVESKQEEFLAADVVRKYNDEYVILKVIT